MSRSLIAFGALILVGTTVRADPPAVTGPAPRITLARVAEGKLILEDAVAEMRMVTESRTITENGVTKTVNVAVPVTAMRLMPQAFLLKDIRAFDLDGRQVTPGRLGYMLKERTAVAISSGGTKLDPAFR